MDLKSDFEQQIVKELFEMRQVFHNEHLKTKSYAQHKALQDAYEGILDLADEIIESFQGKYGIVKIDSFTCDYDDMIKYTVNCAEYFEDIVREGDYPTWVNNQFDEITTLLYQTVYKLKNLK